MLLCFPAFTDSAKSRCAFSSALYFSSNFSHSCCSPPRRERNVNISSSCNFCSCSLTSETNAASAAARAEASKTCSLASEVRCCSRSFCLLKSSTSPTSRSRSSVDAATWLSLSSNEDLSCRHASTSASCDEIKRSLLLAASCSSPLAWTAASAACKAVASLAATETSSSLTRSCRIFTSSVRCTSPTAAFAASASKLLCCLCSDTSATESRSFAPASWSSANCNRSSSKTRSVEPNRRSFSKAASASCSLAVKTSTSLTCKASAPLMADLLDNEGIPAPLQKPVCKVIASSTNMAAAVAVNAPKTNLAKFRMLPTPH
mmetsp:Transcript_14483/g.32914  ORF Transcript_14483/g.32914 Transcript_14483/m.32914 type:complete len:318 (+) Transcript_14483:460-1413(+)